MYKIAAFYTKGTPYEDRVEEFKQNVESFGYTPIIKAYPNMGSWVLNCGLKPIFLSSLMEKIDEDILYLDIDARIRKPLTLFADFQGEVGLHYRHGREVLSGTIYLRNCQQVQELLRDWCREQSKEPGVWDQRILQRILPNHNLVVQNLPPSYTQIFDRMAHHGDPVIEHLQFSRSYKKQIQDPRIEIPTQIGKVRIRRGPEGGYYITRRDRQAEEFLDLHCVRKPNILKWYPKTESKAEIYTLRPVFQRKDCYIVGKGPSLDRLSQADFPDKDSPILAINEAVFKVHALGLPNPLFGIQQDSRLKDTCKPEGVDLFVSVKAANFYQGGIYIYDPRTYGLTLNTLSAMAAIKISEDLGAKGHTMLCFDASCNGQLGYAQAVGYPSTRGGRPERFLTHRDRIESLSKNIRWVMPGARD